MYAALWRVIPGPVWLRALIAVVLVAAILFSLVAWVFPWINDFVLPQEVTVDS